MSDVPPPLSALYVVFHTLVALVGWLVLGGLLATPVMMLGNAGWLSATAALVLTMVIGQAITLVPVLRRGVARAALRPRMRQPWLIPLALAAVMCVNFLVVRRLGLPVSGAGPSGAAVGAGDMPWAILAALSVAVAAPVVEELFFRGWLWQRLASVWSPTSVGVATGVAFALAHGQYGASVLPLTVALTVLRLREGGVRSTIALHMAMNTLVVLTMG